MIMFFKEKGSILISIKEMNKLETSDFHETTVGPAIHGMYKRKET